MAEPFRPKGRDIWFVNVPALGKTKPIDWVKKTTGTQDKRTAGKMQAMVDKLGPSELLAFDVLQRVTSGGLTLAELWQKWVACGEKLPALRSALEDESIEPYVASFGVYCETNLTLDEGTTALYQSQLRTLIPEGEVFMRSRLTQKGALAQWLANLKPQQKHRRTLKSGTRRNYAIAMRRFCAYLKNLGVLDYNPMDDVEIPAMGDRREVYLTPEEWPVLLDRLAPLDRQLAALMMGSGIELSVALQLRRRDWNDSAKQMSAPGTKTWTRRRMVRPADWSLPYIKELVKDKLPDALLFEGIGTQYTVTTRFRKVAQELGELGHEKFIDDPKRGLARYTPRDHRHTFAVYHVSAGVPTEVVAKQMGHANNAMVEKVYGRYLPTAGDRDRWAKVASEYHAKRAAEGE